MRYKYFGSTVPFVQINAPNFSWSLDKRINALQKIFALGLCLICSWSSFATDTELWNRSIESNQESIDHSLWQDILEVYIVPIVDVPNKPPVNLFRYKDVSDSDKEKLNKYLEMLQAIDPRDYRKVEQYAYWLNIYNAYTVKLILENYPTKTIRSIGGGLLPLGPWDDDAVTIAGEVLTLNDVEHKILRPIWLDPRVHYGVNCASYGCPNLASEAFTSKNLERLLNAGAKAYVNHPRGVGFEGNKLTVSSIYKWFKEDFGDSEAELLDHLKSYAEPQLKAQLENFSGRIKYDYSWDLNEPY